MIYFQVCREGGGREAAKTKNITKEQQRNREERLGNSEKINQKERWKPTERGGGGHSDKFHVCVVHLNV